MTDKWIVSDYKYCRQKTLEIAIAEKERLAALYPEKKFRIYRIHQYAQPGKADQVLPDHAAEIERLKAALHGVIGYALTSRSESKGWLEGMAEKIDEAAQAMGDTDRAVVEGDGLRVKRGTA